MTKAYERRVTPVFETNATDDTEFLIEGDWKRSGSMWIDPFTRNRLSFDAAYAVEQERFRVSKSGEDKDEIIGQLTESVKMLTTKVKTLSEGVAEDVHVQPVPVKKTPKLLSDYASGLLEGNTSQVYTHIPEATFAYDDAPTIPSVGDIGMGMGSGGYDPMELEMMRNMEYGG